MSQKYQLAAHASPFPDSRPFGYGFTGKRANDNPIPCLKLNMSDRLKRAAFNTDHAKVPRIATAHTMPRRNAANTAIDTAVALIGVRTGSLLTYKAKSLGVYSEIMLVFYYLTSRELKTIIRSRVLTVSCEASSIIIP